MSSTHSSKDSSRGLPRPRVSSDRSDLSDEPIEHFASFRRDTTPEDDATAIQEADEEAQIHHSSLRGGGNSNSTSSSSISSRSRGRGGVVTSPPAPKGTSSSIRSDSHSGTMTSGGRSSPTRDTVSSSVLSTDHHASATVDTSMASRMKSRRSESDRRKSSSATSGQSSSMSSYYSTTQTTSDRSSHSSFSDETCFETGAESSTKQSSLRAVTPTATVTVSNGSGSRESVTRQRSSVVVDVAASAATAAVGTSDSVSDSREVTQSSTHPSGHHRQSSGVVGMDSTERRRVKKDQAKSSRSSRRSSSTGRRSREQSGVTSSSSSTTTALTKRKKPASQVGSSSSKSAKKGSRSARTGSVRKSSVRFPSNQGGWHYVSSEGTMGPMKIRELRQRRIAREISEDHYVWHAKLTENLWKKISDVGGLMGVLNLPPTPPPLPKSSKVLPLTRISSDSGAVLKKPPMMSTALPKLKIPSSSSSRAKVSIASMEDPKMNIDDQTTSSLLVSQKQQSHQQPSSEMRVWQQTVGQGLRIQTKMLGDHHHHHHPHHSHHSAPHSASYHKSLTPLSYLMGTTSMSTDRGFEGLLSTKESEDHSTPGVMIDRAEVVDPLHHHDHHHHHSHHPSHSFRRDSAISTSSSGSRSTITMLQSDEIMMTDTLNKSTSEPKSEQSSLLLISALPATVSSSASSSAIRKSMSSESVSHMGDISTVSEEPMTMQMSIKTKRSKKGRLREIGDVIEVIERRPIGRLRKDLLVVSKEEDQSNQSSSTGTVSTPTPRSPLISTTEGKGESSVTVSNPSTLNGTQCVSSSIATTGIPLDWFPERQRVVQSGLICAWCSCVPSQAIRLGCGDHLSCDGCPRYCPLCDLSSSALSQSPLSSADDDRTRSIRRKIERLTVRCPIVVCDWQGPLKDYLPAHRASHYSTKVAPVSTLPSMTTAGTTKTTALPTGLTWSADSSPKQSVITAIPSQPQSSKLLTVPTSVHLPCDPLSSASFGSSRSSDSHSMVMTPSLKCTFNKYGCTFRGTDDELEQHRRDSVVDHLEMQQRWIEVLSQTEKYIHVSYSRPERGKRHRVWIDDPSSQTSESGSDTQRRRKRRRGRSKPRDPGSGDVTVTGATSTSTATTSATTTATGCTTTAASSSSSSSSSQSVMNPALTPDELDLIAVSGIYKREHGLMHGKPLFRKRRIQLRWHRDRKWLFVERESGAVLCQQNSEKATTRLSPGSMFRSRDPCKAQWCDGLSLRPVGDLALFELTHWLVAPSVIRVSGRMGVNHGMNGVYIKGSNMHCGRVWYSKHSGFDSSDYSGPAPPIVVSSLIGSAVEGYRHTGSKDGLIMSHQTSNPSEMKKKSLSSSASSTAKWTIRYHSSTVQWMFDKRGLCEDDTCNVVGTCDVMNPTQVLIWEVHDGVRFNVDSAISLTSL